MKIPIPPDFKRVILPGLTTPVGRSLLSVLKGETATARDTIFDFFPHYIKVNDQVPAASVREGDWKLLRFFHDGSQPEDLYELYNLRDNWGESKNLASSQPDRVKALAELLDNFLKDTKAVVPGANPAYKPTSGKL